MFKTLQNYFGMKFQLNNLFGLILFQIVLLTNCDGAAVAAIAGFNSPGNSNSIHQYPFYPHYQNNYGFNYPSVEIPERYQNYQSYPPDSLRESSNGIHEETTTTTTQRTRDQVNARFSREGVEHGKSYVVTMYHWNNHLGRPVPLEWNDDEVESRACKQVPDKSRGKIRSVNTHNNCVVIYSRERCVGPHRILKVGSPSHNRLSDLCFHKRAVSARPCMPEEDNGSNDL